MSPTIQLQSEFMGKFIPVFLERFVIDYYKEDSCIEYFVNNKSTNSTISSSIVLSLNAFKNDLHVSSFHPELHLEENSKYMSAVCFYLIIQHCSTLFSLNNACYISLETIPDIADSFYKKLKDFNFHLNRYELGNVVRIVSNIGRCPMDTSSIKEHIFSSGEIPFMR